MFIDASVIVAILLQEDGYQAYLKVIENATDQFFCSPLVKYEATVSIARARSGSVKPTKDQVKLAQKAVERFLETIHARDILISTSIGQSAIETASVYGKTVGHIAGLNHGDCFSYACAKAYRTKLLYEGNDFVETDLA